MVYKQGTEVVHDKSAAESGDATKAFYEDLHKSALGKPGSSKEEIAAAETNKNLRTLNSQLNKDGLSSDVNVVGAAKVNNEYIVFLGTSPGKNDHVYSLDDKGKIKDVYDVKTDAQGHKVFVKERTTDSTTKPSDQKDPQKNPNDKSKWTQEAPGVYKDSTGHTREIDRQDGKKEMVEWDGDKIKQVKILDSSGAEKESFTRNGDKFDHTVDGKAAQPMKDVSLDGTTLTARTDTHETHSLQNGVTVDYQKFNGQMRPQHIYNTSNGTEINFGDYESDGKPTQITIKKDGNTDTLYKNEDGNYAPWPNPWMRSYNVNINQNGTMTMHKYNVLNGSYDEHTTYDPAKM